MSRIKPGAEYYNELRIYINEGKIKIPQFQREFVWGIKESASLIDSIIKDFPIGSILFWSTDEELRCVKEVGNIKFAERPKGEKIKYILDGQQRVTSAYVVLEGQTISLSGNPKDDVDYSNVFIDLDAEDSDPIVVTDPVHQSNDPDRYIKVCELFSASFDKLVNYPPKYYSNLSKYGDVLKRFQFPAIELSDADIDVATEVFTRLNTGGKSLSAFEIMVAKTYDEEKDFDLSDKYSQAIERLSEIGYDTISDTTILQVVSVLLTSKKGDKDIHCTTKQILALNKHDFINIWDEAVDAIYEAVNYFKTHYRIHVSKLLPYPALIVPYAYYFYKEGKAPSGEVEEKLTDLFWRISLGRRYTSATATKLAQDIQRVNAIIRGEQATYDWSITIEPDDIIAHGRFSVGRSYIKAILSILAACHPLSFKNNAVVNISNDYLKAAHSRNYHHFFPKDFMQKKIGGEDWRVNTIANITIVDDFLNKREIKTRAPSDYMAKFAKENKEIASTMKTHLIGDLKEWGILENYFDKFIYKRAEAISKEIKKRIIPQDNSSSK